ncbi:MAG TPA: hypothetical protein PLX84_11195, partial [Acidiphilium sp.]|nr:hypothetical protein [Acidiphilium sp.]
QIGRLSKKTLSRRGTVKRPLPRKLILFRNVGDEAQSCRSIGLPYTAACRIQGALLNRKAMVDRPDAGIVTNGHKVSHTILDVFTLSFQNTKNHPINAKKLSQQTVPLGYTLSGHSEI